MADPLATTALQPWTVTASRHPLRDRWISVRADDCRTADGAVLAPFYILEFPDWVQVVAIDDADHLICVRQYRHGSGAVMLELPCGGADPADAGPVATAQRELLEETGYGGGEWRLVATSWPNAANSSNRSFTVLATGVAPVAAPVLDPSEELELVRLPVDDAVALALGGGLRAGDACRRPHAGLDAARPLARLTGATPPPDRVHRTKLLLRGTQGVRLLHMATCPRPPPLPARS